MIKIGKITLGMCQTNCYFVYREGSNKVIFFDPADQGAYLYKALKQKGFEVSAIFLTHGHFDHIWGAQELRGLSGAKIYAWEEEADLLSDSGLNVSAGAGRPCTLKVNGFYKDGDEITVEDIKFKIIGTPGHTKGSCCFYFEEANILVSGDTLFEGSVGRSDFPTGSGSELIRSIKDKLLDLPEDTLVYPGHGGSTTIKDEKEFNPFLA